MAKSRTSGRVADHWLVPLGESHTEIRSISAPMSDPGRDEGTREAGPMLATHWLNYKMRCVQ